GLWRIDRRRLPRRSLGTRSIGKPRLESALSLGCCAGRSHRARRRLRPGPRPHAGHGWNRERGRSQRCLGARPRGAPGVDAVWALALDGAPAWTQVMPTEVTPSRRDGISAAYDSFRNRMIIYGGGGAYVDVWAVNLSAPVPTWSMLSPSGTPPVGRAYYTAI